MSVLRTKVSRIGLRWIVASALIAGVPLTAFAGWSLPATQLSLGSYAYGYVVTFDKKGNALAAWTQVDDSSDLAIYTAFRPKDGVFQPSTKLSSPATSDAEQPSVAFDKAGNAVLAWTEWNGSSYDLKVAFRPKGGTFGDATIISDPGEDFYDFRTAYDSKGTAIVTWKSNGVSPLIRAAVCPKGGSFGAAVTLAAAGDNANGPYIVADAKGNTIIAWTASSGTDSVAVQVTRSKDGTFGAQEQISANGLWAYDLSLAVDKKGNELVLWESSDGMGSSYIFSAFKPKGGTFASPVQISDDSGYDYEPNVAFDGKGNAIASWTQDDALDYHVRVADRPKDGTFGASTIVSANSDDASSAVLLVDPKGNTTLVWNVQLYDPITDTSTYRIVATHRATGAADFEPSIDIQPLTTEAGDPAAAIDGKGHVLALWGSDDAMAHEQVKYSFYDPKAP